MTAPHAGRFLVLALLLLAAPGPSLAAPRVALISLGSAPLERSLLREITALVGRSGARALGPGEAGSKLEAEPGPTSSRQRAASLLARATELTRNVRYDEALATLTAAESSAEAGLASLVAPRLLAEVYLQRGLALLATDPSAGQRWLVRSLQLWPSRALDPSVHAPRILQALRLAARDAKRAGAREPHEADLGQAARVLEAQSLLLIRVEPGSSRVTLRRFDARRELLSAPIELDGPGDRTPAAERRALRELAAWFPPAEEAVQPRRTASPARWILLGASVAAIGGGIGLAVHAQVRANDAESLAGRTPLVEYAPEVRDAEDASRSARTGAIVCFSLGAAALVAAVVVWARARPSRPSSLQVSVAPAGLGLTF